MKDRNTRITLKMIDDMSEALLDVARVAAECGHKIRNVTFAMKGEKTPRYIRRSQAKHLGQIDAHVRQLKRKHKLRAKKKNLLIK